MTHEKFKCILLAEDNANDMELTLLALRQQDFPHRIEVAHDGEEALDFLHCRNQFQARARCNPHLVILDLKMPKMNGLEVLRTMKGDARLRTIPVVIFTSSRQASDVRESYACGANAYVVKPVGFREFSGTIQSIRSFWINANEPPPDLTCD